MSRVDPGAGERGSPDDDPAVARELGGESVIARRPGDRDAPGRIDRHGLRLSHRLAIEIGHPLVVPSAAIELRHESVGWRPCDGAPRRNAADEIGRSVDSERDARGRARGDVAARTEPQDANAELGDDGRVAVRSRNAQADRAVGRHLVARGQSGCGSVDRLPSDGREDCKIAGAARPANRAVRCEMRLRPLDPEGEGLGIDARGEIEAQRDPIGRPGDGGVHACIHRGGLERAIGRDISLPRGDARPAEHVGGPGRELGSLDLCVRGRRDEGQLPTVRVCRSGEREATRVEGHDAVQCVGGPCDPVSSLYLLEAQREPARRGPGQGGLRHDSLRCDRRDERQHERSEE